MILRVCCSLITVHYYLIREEAFVYARMNKMSRRRNEERNLYG